ncbi:hypothetical protein F2Q70_00031952 [Brassica cretica]|uniref:Uncharacterized protein n=1 Tax=Brassica cretica TaxID=69181 RepID=A0A8S9FHJ1_BRACR|nr:hypothetical protein F2Q70_00031952 [Brassica cretica]
MHLMHIGPTLLMFARPHFQIDTIFSGSPVPQGSIITGTYLFEGCEALSVSIVRPLSQRTHETRCPPNVGVEVNSMAFSWVFYHWLHLVVSRETAYPEFFLEFEFVRNPDVAVYMANHADNT